MPTSAVSGCLGRTMLNNRDKFRKGQPVSAREMRSIVSEAQRTQAPAVANGMETSSSPSGITYNLLPEGNTLAALHAKNRVVCYNHMAPSIPIEAHRPCFMYGCIQEPVSSSYERQAVPVFNALPIHIYGAYNPATTTGQDTPTFICVPTEDIPGEGTGECIIQGNTLVQVKTHPDDPGPSLSTTPHGYGVPLELSSSQRWVYYDPAVNPKYLLSATRPTLYDTAIEANPPLTIQPLAKILWEESGASLDNGCHYALACFTFGVGGSGGGGLNFIEVPNIASLPPNTTTGPMLALVLADTSLWFCSSVPPTTWYCTSHIHQPEIR